MSKIDDFRISLREAIEKNTIVLPTLPEVALKVRDAAEQQNTTAGDIASIIATDAAISARLLQVANSAMYRPRSPIENIQMAVTRLGNKLVRSLVTSLAMKQIYQATTDHMEKRLRKVWENSVQVAAVCRVLAQNLPQLENEQAMLAGLIHNIGILPILTFAESHPECDEQDYLDEICLQLYPEIGTIILEHWDFPDILSVVPLEHANLFRQHDSEVDYTDLVIVARIQLGLDTVPDDDWSRVSAFEKAGLETDIHVVEIEDTREEIDEVKQMLV